MIDLSGLKNRVTVFLQMQLNHVIPVFIQIQLNLVLSISLTETATATTTRENLTIRLTMETRANRLIRRERRHRLCACRGGWAVPENHDVTN